MNILVTGARGFVGKNLVAALQNIRDGKERTHPELDIREIFEYDTDGSPEQLADYAKSADFVFHLAGVNRPKTAEEYLPGNTGSLEILLAALQNADNRCPVMLASSAQASLVWRYAGSEYGKAKLACEKLLRTYAAETGAEALIYRFPNVFGKWSRPNYNSVVATFCHNIARGLPITVNDPAAQVPLVYIDDVAAAFVRALEGAAMPDAEGRYAVKPEYRITVGDLAAMLGRFRDMRDRLECPDQSDPLTAKLYATYLSFLPPEDFARPTITHADARGSFTELLHLGGHGQVSVNVSRPHITKGEHWHHTKHEKFVVLSGEGVIRFRRPGDATVISYRVSGEVPQVVDIPPGYTHNIENTGDTDMITLMWANECFDPARPDTIRLPVEGPKEEAK